MLPRVARVHVSSKGSCSPCASVRSPERVQKPRTLTDRVAKKAGCLQALQASGHTPCTRRPRTHNSACSWADSQVCTAASASRLARASADEPAALHSMCTSRRRHSDARPQCFSNTVTHWYQAVCLERVSARYYVRSARGRRPMLIAVPGAAPVERQDAVNIQSIAFTQKMPHVADRVARTLRAAGHEPTVTHRNLDSAPQDGLEGKPPPASPAPGGQT